MFGLVGDLLPSFFKMEAFVLFRPDQGSSGAAPHPKLIFARQINLK